MTTLAAAPIGLPGSLAAAPDRRLGGACAEIARRLRAPVGFVRTLTFISLEFVPYAFLIYLGVVLLLPQGGRRWPGAANLVGALRFGAFMAALLTINLGGLSVDEIFRHSPTLWISEGGVCAVIVVALLVPTPRSDLEVYERQLLQASVFVLAVAGLLFAGAVIVPQVRWERVAAAAAVVTGFGISFAATRRSVRAWLIPGAVAVAGLTLLTGSGARLQGGIGDHYVRVSQVEALQPSYRRAVGTMTVNLNGMHAGGRVVDLALSVGVGRLRIILPALAAARLDVRVGRGSVFSTIRGEIDGVDVHQRLSGVSPFRKSDPTVRLRITASVGIGSVDIERAGGNTEPGSV